MVALITEGTAFDKHGRPFRRRNHVPVLCLFLALAVATGVVWVIGKIAWAVLYPFAVVMQAIVSFVLGGSASA